MECKLWITKAEHLKLYNNIYLLVKISCVPTLYGSSPYIRSSLVRLCDVTLACSGKSHSRSRAFSVKKVPYVTFTKRNFCSENLKKIDEKVRLLTPNFFEKFTFFEKLFFIQKLFQKDWWPVSFEDKPFHPLPLFSCLNPFMLSGN